MSHWVAKTRITSVDKGFRDLVHVLKSNHTDFQWMPENDMMHSTALFSSESNAVNAGLATPRPDGYGLAFHEVWAEDESPKPKRYSTFEEGVKDIERWRKKGPKI